MEKVFNSKTALKVWNYVRSWVIFIALFLVLRYTGMLAGISYVTGRAIMRTGVMDAHHKESTTGVAKKFNYNFNIRDLNGEIIRVNEFKGKTVFLNLWATWCGPCRLEMPSIERLYQQVDDEKIVFIMLSVDRPQDLNKVKSYISEKEFTFPVFTPADFLPAQLQVKSIPTTFIIGPDGRIVSTEMGATNFDTSEFREFLEQIQAE
jgi:thiol-disulfide isomerase/thioredoxin